MVMISFYRENRCNTGHSRNWIIYLVTSRHRENMAHYLLLTGQERHINGPSIIDFNQEIKLYHLHEMIFLIGSDTITTL